ncbi:hypothetical protein OIE68_18120 [Nocardia vinacea]|uniref:hypothetical protein n=1 Tax=Nocardia vinacea TaxID=96468 RepID=UPI002E10F045|nr:hypothetical protein OIE68_18120 [Nocardia vinacea]
MTVIVGMDPHERSATIEIIDKTGRILATGRYATTPSDTRKCSTPHNDSPIESGQSRAATASADTSVRAWPSSSRRSASI